MPVVFNLFGFAAREIVEALDVISFKEWNSLLGCETNHLNRLTFQALKNWSHQRNFEHVLIDDQ